MLGPMPIGIRYLACRLRPAGDVVKAHRHQHEQWFYCHRGLLPVTIDGVPHPLGPGEAVLIRPGAVRALEASPRRRCYAFALFENRGLDLTLLYHRPLCLDADLLPDADALVAELQAVGEADSPLLCQALLVRLLISLNRAARRSGAGGSVPADRALVERVERVMRQNLHRSLPREDLARAVHISAPHLARRFKGITGTTLHRRLRELRIAQAQNLLHDSTIAIAEVALAVGFSSVSHFTKAFQALAGRTPREWRRSFSASIASGTAIRGRHTAPPVDRNGWS
jgi:AraC-like DNA-binding protein